MDFGTYGTVHLLWRLSGLQCSITRTTWAAASRTSTCRSTGRIPTPVGVGILQAHFNFRAFCFFFFQGDVHQCGILLYLCAASATARSHKWSALEEEQGSHTNLASSSLQFVFLFASRRVARARLGTHSCAAPREKEECTVDRVCHVSLRAGMCLPDKLSIVTLSMSPTQKCERTHETRVRRTTLTTCYTDTSGNSESVRAPRTARSTTRACSHTSLCRSCLSNAHHLPPRPPSLW